MDPFRDALYDNAVSYIRTLVDLKKTHFNGKFFYVYVLMLDNYEIYVGQTNNIYLRLFQHAVGEGARWTAERGPIRAILEIVINAKDEDEKYKTLEYMHKYGYESVRGSYWTRGDLKGPPRDLESFRPHRTDFTYLDAKELVQIEIKYKQIWDMYNKLSTK